VADTFSVVVATRNRVDRAVAQVEALRAQDQAPEEIVVVDDGSDDGTGPRLAEVPAPPIVVRTESVGPASARNAGVAVASGRWIVFLDDDDVPDAGWLDGFRTLAAEHPTARHLSMPYRVRRDGTVGEHPIRDLGPAFDGARASFLAGTFAVRRDDLDAVGGFTEGLRNMEFTDLALRLFATIPAGERVVGDRPLLTIESRDWTRRDSQVPENFVESVETVLGRSGDLLARDGHFLANTLATLAVAELRRGHVSAARRHLARAFRADPWPPRHLLRWAITFVPPLRRRVWRLPAAS
jgi:glycosyltransferase involved in cell wall biosynthesis